ncbi:MAG: hypothetical protein OQK48_01655 [Sulfurimonas sp.]|uniref:hypothetical protein n=1 Tax=Sulfurimonas sp. TaxID=2022749 RepID=UPI002619584B|nr:hypothetical protein [Sulfurimonas sp.]MCW8895040.1 hypothetical protein [Sulfurimonas sp.]MCW8953628.1 hypothetical protein [Sulfurimonas sp.]MCW9067341.1 hypothetical protein [Sulfurimonas sp.]
MIHYKVKNYLKTNIPKPSIDYEWTSEDSKKLLYFLKENFPKISISDEENELKIKQAFSEHFESVGEAQLKITEKNITLKIKEYIPIQESKHIDSIIDMLEDNDHLVEYDYRGKEDLILIPEALSQGVIALTNNITDEIVNKKELINFAIREAFGLISSDIIAIRNNQILIKLFDESTIREVAEDEKNTIANRFNGINEKDLKSFHDDIFSKTENKDFFYFVAEDFVNMFFIDKKINNVTYEKYVFSFIQSITTELLVETFDHNYEFFKGFSGYIFRLHFKEVFGYIADLVLLEISTSNRYMMDFLKYYSLDIVVQNGIKYKVPEIEAKNGLKWNVASMISIVKIYTKMDMSIKEIKIQKAELSKAISKFNAGGISPVEYNSTINKAINKLTVDINHGMKRLNIHADMIDSAKDESTKKVLKDDFILMKKDIQAQKDEKDRLTSKLINKNDLAQYTSLKTEMDALVRQERREEVILAQNKEAYMSIKNSLIKALTSKKIPLEEVNIK